MSLSVSVCLSVCVCVCVCLSLSLSLSLLPPSVSLSLSLCHSVSVSLYVSVCLSVCLSVSPSLSLCEYVERIDVETDNIIALRLLHRLLGTPTDCLLIGAYVPPEKSPYYGETDIYNGVSLLEDCMLDLIRVCGDIPFIICGDLNARTASMNARDVDPMMTFTK